MLEQNHGAAESAKNNTTGKHKKPTSAYRKLRRVSQKPG